MARESETHMDIRRICWQKTIPLRHQVLWPSKPPEYCHVDGDVNGLHFGVFIGETIICVASVYLDQNEARLRKFATDANYQNQGVGSKMLAHIIDDLKSTNTDLFWCDARESAVGFYERFDMLKASDRFYKADVAYFKMEIVLSLR